MLWLTRGYRRDDPYAAMTVGFMRCITYELPQLRTQLLDIDQSRIVDGKLLAEMLLRLHIAEDLESAEKKPVWTAETEVVVEDELLIIPRMKPQVVQNKRYNSARRPITKVSDLSSSLVNVEWLETKYVLREELGAFRHDINTHASIDVEVSLLSTLRVPAGRVFFSIGVDKGTGTKVLSASLSNTSTISVPKNCSIPIDLPRCSEVECLTAIVWYILNQFLSASMPAGGVLLVHEPSEALARLLLAPSQHQIVLTTCSTGQGEDWIYVHPQSSSRAVKSLLPSGVSLFLDMSSDELARGIASKISATLPRGCQRVDSSTLLSNESFILTTEEGFDSPIYNMLHSAKSFALAYLQSADSTNTSSLPEISLSEVSKSDHQPNPLSVINWRSESKVTTLLESVDARKQLFKDNKTYWLVGLAGDLGQSLCDWMADHGARYIVLMSRSRRVENNWVKKHKANGTTIIFMKGQVALSLG